MRHPVSPRRGQESPGPEPHDPGSGAQTDIPRPQEHLNADHPLKQLREPADSNDETRSEARQGQARQGKARCRRRSRGEVRRGEVRGEARPGEVPKAKPRPGEVPKAKPRPGEVPKAKPRPGEVPKAKPRPGEVPMPVGEIPHRGGFGGLGPPTKSETPPPALSAGRGVPEWRCRESNPGPSALHKGFSVRSPRCLYSDPPVMRTSRCDDPSRCLMSRPTPRPGWTVSPLTGAGLRSRDAPGPTDASPRSGGEGESVALNLLVGA